MAWTTPRTWATGEVVSSANMNTHVRDNLSFLGSPPACSVSGAATSTTNGVTTTLPAATEDYDTDTMHSTVTNNSRITINTPGRYQITALVRWASNATGGRTLSLLVNGSTSHDLAAVAASPSTDTFLSGTKNLVLAATDFVEVRATQFSGGALNATLENFTAKLETVV